NILKRLLVHAGAFNLGLIMRLLTGAGTPRRLHGRLTAMLTVLTALMPMLHQVWDRFAGCEPSNRPTRGSQQTRSSTSCLCDASDFHLRLLEMYRLERKRCGSLSVTHARVSRATVLN